MSPRAVETLKSADFIAAEDTRVTLKLLNHFEIKKPLVSYFEHNKRQKGEYIIGRILAGETCILVSDAGLPAISDPGEDLVSLCHIKNINVTMIPGSCACVSALSVSGLPSGRFTFEGFLSVNKKSRNDHLASIKLEPRTMIFYEAPHKLLQTLKDLYEAFGNRKISVIRELTKIHEEVFLTTLKSAIDKYESEPIKGEFVLVIEGHKAEQTGNNKVTLTEAVKMATPLLESGLSISETARQIAKDTGLKKGDIYKELLKL